MGTPVFGAAVDKPTVLKAGKAIVTVDGTTMLALNVTVQFQRQVELVPVLGKKRVVSIGEPQGTFTCDTIVAKDVDSLKAFHLSEEGCEPFRMEIKFDDNACDANGKTISAENCIASVISITAQGGRGYIGEGVQVTFTAMTM